MGLESGQIAYIAVLILADFPSGVLQLVFNTPKGKEPITTATAVQKHPHGIGPSPIVRNTMQQIWILI